MGKERSEETIFGHKVLGFAADGDVLLPADMRPYKSTPGHLSGFVEVKGFRPGAGTHLLGILPAGDWVIQAHDQGDPIMVVKPSDCSPMIGGKDKDLNWVKFEEMTEEIQ